VPANVLATNCNNTNEPYPPPPPPAYHEALDNNNLPIQTYYQPPPAPILYPPPPLEQELPARNPVTQFYSPTDNRKLALKRRVSSCLCCIVIIVIVVGLAAGLTQSTNYDNRYCEWYVENRAVYI
jgi:hypothetical protein